LNDPITDDYQYYLERYCNSFKVPAKGEKERWTGYFLKNKKKNNFNELSFNEQQELKEYIRNHARMITVANGESNLDELRERTQHIYLRRVKEDLKGMVKKTIHEIYYNLTPLQQEEYNRLWDEYETAQRESDPEKELNKELIEGGLYRRYLSQQMVPKTIKIVDDIISKNEKVVIACCYDEELYALQEYYGDKCVIYNGKLNSKQKDYNKDEFINNPNIKVFIGNIQAAGVGITLTVAKYLIFNTFDWVSGNNNQMQDRIHRIGQTRDVDIYYQIFNNTQYQRMWDIVMRKQMVIDAIIKTENEK
jgi:SWI/SNF-related matrix-associated actin-dependent regulator 1 of chromatin subfamily A